MPADARERLAGLMLDALDFGGGKKAANKNKATAGRKVTPKPKLKDNSQLARGRAYGITEAGTRVAADLSALVDEILLHQKGGPVDVQQLDSEGNPVTDSTGKPVFEKRHKTVDEMLRDWRGRAQKTQQGQQASIAEYARFMSQNSQRSDYESRVLSLYKALGGPYHTDEVSRATVKRTKKTNDVMHIDVLINLYKRARAALGVIMEKGETAENSVKRTERGKKMLRELEQLKSSLHSDLSRMPRPKAG